MDRSLLLLPPILVLGGCLMDSIREDACEPITEGQLARLPTRLSETGLFADMATETLAEGVMAYEPQFPLWSDGSTKRRWLWLPPGTQIDTSDADFWQFPEGTRLWKEFTRDGIRVETRMLQKVGPAPEAWVPLAYIWDDDGRDASAAPNGTPNAKGTTHDVPDATTCMGCHVGTPSRVLGVSAVQLAYDAPAGMTDLADLINAGCLTAPPSPSLRVPGNELERFALGYLHANCAHCHNQRRPNMEPNQELGPIVLLPPPGTAPPRCFDPWQPTDFMLYVADLGRVEDTATYRTAVGDVITRGKPDESSVVGRMRTGTMPRLGVEIVDTEGLQKVRDWISALQ